MQIEIRHLRYFVAVADELHFGRAAQRLHIAQPPLSRQIQALETELGTQLFRRDRRRIQLSGAGRAFLPAARAALIEFDRALSVVRRAVATAVDQLRVGYGWSVTFEVLPAVAQTLRQRHPEIGLVAQQMWNVDLVEALLAATIDVGVTRYPARVPQLAYETIRSEPVVVLVPSSHPLAARSPTPLASLATEQLIMFPRELAPEFYDELVGICHSAAFEPSVLSDSFHTAWDLDLLASGSGVALAPAGVTSNTPAGVTIVQLAPPVPRLTMTVCWRRDAHSSALEAFVSTAREVAEERGWLAAL
jgi:DNA-binding transcriptional LysR family regulator